MCMPGKTSCISNKQEDSYINMRPGGVAVAFYFVAFFLASECRFLFKDFAPKETRTRGSVCFHAGKLMNPGDSWARTLASGERYHCTCTGSIVDCSLMRCPKCPHGILKAHEEWCPQCRPEPTSPAFTIPSPFRLHDNKK
ncbi:uncharacterized protein [Montipora capricornis]|uniref:uncharacterized protein isoform X7 n=1 Tax=Montipora capricornis TaxID=246305 RepID=UPI0035F17DFA